MFLLSNQQESLKNYETRKVSLVIQNDIAIIKLFSIFYSRSSCFPLSSTCLTMSLIIAMYISEADASLSLKIRIKSRESKWRRITVDNPWDTPRQIARDLKSRWYISSKCTRVSIWPGRWHAEHVFSRVFARSANACSSKRKRERERERKRERRREIILARL